MIKLPKYSYQIGIAAVVVVVVAVYIFSNDSQLRNRGAGGSYGEIYVDSPEIYTRERLVNDRFREDAWLKQMLELLSQEDAALQGFIHSSFDDSASVQLKAGITGPGPKGAASETASGEAGEKKNPRTTKERKDPNRQSILRDRFLRYLDIRDAVRKQIVENQLDDRHDLSANTLYAFKFDVTILPSANDTSAWAKVTVSISQSDRAESEVMATDSKERLFHRWIRHMESVTNKASIERKNLTVDFKHKLVAFAPTLTDHYDSSGDLDPAANIDARVESVVSRLQDLPFGIDPLGWLVSQWVIADMITSRNLDTYADVATVAVGKTGTRIVLTPRTAQTASPYEGFEFEEPVEAESPGQPEIDGLTEFKKLFIARSQTLFTYSVSPRVSVENIEDSGSRLSRQQIATKLLASGDPADVDVALDLAHQAETNMGAIRRNALIVGFADRKRADEYQAQAVFGWFVGPRFQLSDDGKGYYFRHVPNHHALSALIALPAGWPEVKITVKTEWIRDVGFRAGGRVQDSRTRRFGGPSSDRGRQMGASVEPDSYSYYIDLPTDLDKVTAALSTGSLKGESLSPIVFENEMDKVSLLSGRPGAILIQGRNLWRSTVVTIGAQPSDRISVLPNMEGIIAHFESIEPAVNSDPQTVACPTRPVRIWTSTGVAKLSKPVDVCNRSSQSPAAGSEGSPSPAEG